MWGKVDARAVDAALEAAVDSGRVPQAVVMAADGTGTVYAGAAGPVRAGTADGTPVTVDAVFRIASMTKIVTTVAALQLAERGCLDLDSPVHRYRPEFADLLVLAGFRGDEPVLRAPASPATVRQLITHTAGLGYWFFNADLFRWERATGTPGVLSGRREALTAPLVTDPGSRFEYGTGTDWLGLVVEAVAGTGLDAYLDEHLLGPLRMPDTTFRPDGARRDRLVPVHVRDGDGGWRPTGIDWVPDPDWWSGGHGLYSTAGDFLRFQRMLLADGVLDGVRVLAPATVDALFGHHLGPLPFPARIPSAHPASSADLALGQGLTWGLGLLVTTSDVRRRRSAGSGSWSGIHNTHFWVDRRRGLAGALFTQFLPFADPGARRAWRDVETALHAPLVNARRSFTAGAAPPDAEP